MKKVIRKGVFESNSSSTHSICLCGNKYEKLPNYNETELILSGGEFGWEHETYTDWLSKANYVAVEAYCTENDELRKNLKKCLRDNINCGPIVFEFSKDWNKGNYSYIDHQSLGLISQDVGIGVEELSEFIFSDSELSTGNDNSW